MLFSVSGCWGLPGLLSFLGKQHGRLVYSAPFIGPGWAYAHTEPIIGVWSLHPVALVGLEKQRLSCFCHLIPPTLASQSHSIVVSFPVTHSSHEFGVYCLLSALGEARGPCCVYRAVLLAPHSVLTLTSSLPASSTDRSH